jgi:hypothetical protein
MNAAYADTATVPVTRIGTASEQEKQHDGYQDQVHRLPPKVAGGRHAAPMNLRSFFIFHGGR